MRWLFGKGVGFKRCDSCHTNFCSIAGTKTGSSRSSRYTRRRPIMLGLARTSSRLLARPLARSFAEIVPTASANSNAGDSAALALSNPSPSSPAPLHVGLTEAARKNRIPVREDHGLYAFFRKKDGEDLVGDARYETVESPEGLQKRASGM